MRQKAPLRKRGAFARRRVAAHPIPVSLAVGLQAAGMHAYIHVAPSSERSSTRLRSRERQALGISLWPNVAKVGYMCISMYTCRLEPNDQGDSDGQCERASACCPLAFVFFSLS